MSTYTSSLGLEEITPGDQAGLWGNTTNNNLALIDQAITGVTPISFTGLSGTTYTLTNFDGALDEARSSVLNIDGIATGSNTVIVPNKQKTYLVRNNTGRDVIFRTATPTATYTVGAGNSILIFCDGNNNVFTGIASPSVGTLGVAGGGTGQTTFGGGGFVKSSGGTNALTAASTVDLSSEVTGNLPVPRGGTGAASFSAGSLIVGNGTGNLGTLTGGTVGQVATWNGSTWVAQTPSVGTGTVTSVSGAGTVSGLTLSGTVTTSGSLTLGGSLTLTSGQVTTALGYTPYNNSNPSGFITSSSPTITTPTINGFTNGSSAGSGVVGQVVTITSGAPVSLTNGSIVNLAVGTLPAGDWDIYGSWTVATQSGTTLIFVACGRSTAPTTLGGTTGGPYQMTANQNLSVAFLPEPVNIASPQTLYLNMFSQFSGGTASGQVTIYARRMR